MLNRLLNYKFLYKIPAEVLNVMPKIPHSCSKTLFIAGSVTPISKPFHNLRLFFGHYKGINFFSFTVLSDVPYRRSFSFCKNKEHCVFRALLKFPVKFICCTALELTFETCRFLGSIYIVLIFLKV